MARILDEKVSRGNRIAFAAALFAALLLALVMTLLIPASVALAETPSSEPPATGSQDGYQGGTIPILRLTFHDDIDPDTGEVTLSGNDKIDMMNEAPNHSYKAEGVTLDLEVPPTYDNPESDLQDGISGYTGETDLSLEYIRGRGNSSWRAIKKPYKFKLDKSADLFGMGANKHWALIANYYDTSLSIDRLVAWLGDQMGLAFTPRAVPVDLFMNGAYYGNYMLMEEVRTGTNRVDIDVVDENASDPESLDITGGYLIGMNRKPTASSYEFFLTRRNHAFAWDTPEYGEELTDAEKAQQEYLKAHFDRVEDAVYGKNLTSLSGDNAWDLIDKYSLADYWWIQEFTGNRDAFATPSTYLYKLRDTRADDGTVTTGKLYWGPLWDFDYVWGEFPAEGFNVIEEGWVSILRQDPEFVELLKERWRALDGILANATAEGGLLDQYIAEMAQSWEANQERWPKADPYDWPDGSYAETIDELRSHIEARRAWINDNLENGLQTTCICLTFVNDGVEVYNIAVRKGWQPLERAPEAPEKEGMLFEGWFTADGQKYEPYEPCGEDAVFYAKYTKKDDGGDSGDGDGGDGDGGDGGGGSDGSGDGDGGGNGNGSGSGKDSSMGEDGTALGKGASAEAADAAIKSLKGDKDPAGTKFAPLKLASGKTTRTSIKLAWAKLKDAKKYVVYGGRSGKNHVMKKLKDVTGKTVTIKKAGAKLAKGKSYKFIVVALDKDGRVVSTSKLAHAFTEGGKYDNPKSVTVAKKTLAKAKKLKAGKALKLNAKLAKAGRKAVKKLAPIRYESTNPSVATVSAKGVVKAKAKGKCVIYAYAQNGAAKKVKVIVT